MTVQQFLAKHNQTSEQVNVSSNLAAFIGEMKAGLAGKSTIAMFPTYLYEPDFDNIVKNDKRILIDAGGTNFRSATGYFDENGKAVLENMKKTVMPAADKELSKDEFYDAIANNIKRLLPCATDVGFCFSYPVNMEPDKDGTAQVFAKEIKAPQVVGTKVGECTLRAAKKYDGKSRNIVILNDTVATLLGGMAVNVEKKYSAYIGYIYGTGTNLCYAERVENITKVSGLSGNRRMLINTECGNYGGFIQGDYDGTVARNTKEPNNQRFEKMTSGKYLAQIISLCFKGAAEEGVFENAVDVCDFELKDVSLFLSGEKNSLYNIFKTQNDLAAAKYICEELIDRAAKMGAIANAAAAILSGEPNGLPVAIVAEGTTFNKLPGYRATFQNYLTQILTPYGLSFEIVQGEELNMIGSLLATMS